MSMISFLLPRYGAVMKRCGAMKPTPAHSPSSSLVVCCHVMEESWQDQTREGKKQPTGTPLIRSMEGGLGGGGGGGGVFYEWMHH